MIWGLSRLDLNMAALHLHVSLTSSLFAVYSIFDILESSDIGRFGHGGGGEGMCSGGGGRACVPLLPKK